MKMIELVGVIILTISVILNLFFAFYMRWLLINFNFLSENIVNLLDTAENFSNHLAAIHELETFYGDETLHNLLKHSKTVVNIPFSPHTQKH